MTHLTTPVLRLVQSHRGSALVVKMTPEGLLIREKGARTWYGPIDYGWIFINGVKMEVERRRAESGRSKKRRRV